MNRPFPAYKGSDPYLFVSYAHDDAEDVYPQLQWLRAEGFNVWYDEGIEPGSTWRDDVALALTQSKVFLYFISPRSVVSDNCQQELNFALSRERKVLAVHLEPTELPMGLELSLSNKQAIMRADYTEGAYQQKLKGALQSLLPRDAPAPVTAEQPERVHARSIAILPLTNRSSDEENQYLCDGIAEELIGGLAKLEELRVASQLATFALGNQHLDIETIGNKLKVRYVLSGSVQKSGSRVRISVSLNDLEGGHAVWSDRYDGVLDDVFELQETVARKVVDALQVELGASAQDAPLIDAGTRDPRAYNAFLLGMHAFQKMTQRDLLEAIDRFRQAADLDPDFGRANWYVLIAHLVLMRDFGAPRESLLPPAKAAYEAMRKTPFAAPVPDYIVMRCWLNEIEESEPEVASVAIDKVRHPDPEWNNHQYNQVAMSLAAAGLLRGATAYLKHYLDSTPRHQGNTNAVVRYATLLELCGRYDEAIDYISQQLAANPDMPLAAGTRTMLYSRTGQYAKAEQGLAELGRIFPRNFAQFYHLYWTGQMEAAREYYAWLDKQARLHRTFKYWGAFLMGHLDRGFDYLEEAARSGVEPFAIKIAAVRCLPPTLVQEVWAHPRHRAMMERFGVTDAWRGELLDQVNELSPITGIVVGADDEI